MLATSDRAVSSTYIGLACPSLVAHAIGRSEAEVKSDTSALLESIARARNHRQIA